MIRRILTTVLFLCLSASTAEAVLAQVRAARWHAVDPSPSPGVVVLGQQGLDDSSVLSRAKEPGDQRLDHHRDDPEHDPTGEHCAHHHIVGPTTASSREVSIGLTLNLNLFSLDRVPADWTRSPTPEPPRA